MMSEKRFKLVEDSNGLFSIFDNEDKEDEPLIYGAIFGTEKIVDLLNEQQSTITNLQGDINRQKYIIEELRKDNYKKFKRINELEEENEQLREMIDDL